MARTAATQSELSANGKRAAEEFAAGLAPSPPFNPKVAAATAAMEAGNASADQIGIATGATSTSPAVTVVKEPAPQQFAPGTQVLPAHDTPLADVNHELKYHDRSHRYYLNGARAKGVSTVAKLAADDWNIRAWNERMVAIGVMMDPNLRENVAMHIENKDMLANLCEDAKKVAKANLKADRGSQKHRVLELILTNQEHMLITEQQKHDALILKRTMDRYKLVPHGDLAEHFVIWPDHTICGRFDAVLDFEKPDGTTVLVDLKSGENAVKYPHSTLCQLALYAYAPYVSVGDVRGDKVEVTQWRTMPDRLNKESAYVLLVDNESDVGSFHRLNIEHGIKAGINALEMLNWRKEYDKGMGAVVEVVWDPLVDEGLGADIAAITNADDLRALYKYAFGEGMMTEGVKQAFIDRAAELKGAQQQ